MPFTSLEDLLAVDTLTDMIRVFADQADERACTDLFERYAKKLAPKGRSATWDEVVFHRHLAPMTGGEDPHVRMDRMGVEQRSSTMAHIKVYKDLPAPDLFFDRAPGSDTADAEAILSDELLDMANVIANTKEFLASSALNGRIRVNDQTVPGTAINFSVDFEVQQLDASAPWDDPGTKIRSEELKRLKRIYKDTSGTRAGTAITEPNLDTYFVQNDEVREFVKEALGATIVNNMQASGQMPQWANLGGLSWSFTDGTYQPKGGQVERYFPQDTVLVLPPTQRLRQILGWAEGKVFVPAGPVFGEASSSARQIRVLQGSYAYAKVRHDPMGVRVYAGWHGLPVVLNPRGVMVFSVRPQPAPVPAP